MSALRPYTLLCSFLLLTSAFSQAAFGQSGVAAQLSGLVTDPNGAVLVGVPVTARNTETGLKQDAQTSSEGRYVLVNLPPGFYEVVAVARGFAPLRYEGVALVVGQNATRDFSLKLASTSQEVTINEGTALVERDRTEQSQVIEERRIEQLPINGRQFLDFILLTPNVDLGRSNIANQARPGEPNQVDLSFAGLEEIASLVTVDGGDNTNRLFGRSRSTPSQEAVREFRVVTNGYNAELGPAGGAVINIVTKSGTNVIHGSAYYYLRNDALDARNMLAPPGFDELSQNQFGGTLGGPLVRDRLFLFGNYEGQRREESPFYSTVLLNNLSSINAAKQSLGLSPEVLEGKLRKLNYDSVAIRSDYQRLDGHQLNLIYRFRDERGANLGAATGQLSAPSHFRDAKIRDHALVSNWTSSLTARLVNQGLFQFARRRFDFRSVSFEPNLEIPNTLDLGRAFNAPDTTRETRFEFGDTLSYMRGAHSLKLGGAFYRVHSELFLDALDPGYVLFPTLDAFLGKPPFPPFPFAVLFTFHVGPDGRRPAAPRGFTGPANLPTFESFTRTESWLTHGALFAQDQWRVTSKLTLNYGLRWDVDNLPAEGYERYYRAFQPRVGLAYSALSDHLVLRATGGIYQGVKDLSEYLYSRIYPADPALGIINPEYSVAAGGLHGIMISNPAVAAPAFLQFAHTGIYPAATQPGQLPGPNLSLSVHRTNPRGLYTYQWNAQVDYQLASEVVFSVGYLGLRGLNLSSGAALNVAPATLRLTNGKSNYAVAPDVPTTRVFNPLVSPFSLFFDDVGQSLYHAGTTTLTKRFSRKHAFTLNYTWSKALDNSGSLAIADLPEDNYRRDLERSRSKQHVPHRFTGSFIAEGPDGTWLRDFRLSLISTLASAHYYTLFVGFDVNNDGNPLTDRVGTLGRSTFQGDSYANFDLRLARTFKLSERVRAKVIAEAFNLFNTLNVTEVNSVYGAPQLIGPEPKKFGQAAPAPLPSFGSIRAIAAPRQIQFAFRLNF